MSFELAEYNSSESESELDNEPKKQVQRRQYTWLYKSTFENPTDAKEWVDEQKIWSLYYSYDTDAGRRDHYRCNLVPYRGVQCAAAMQLLYNSDSCKVSLFISKEEHDHEQSLKQPKKGFNLIKNFY